MLKRFYTFFKIFLYNIVVFIFLFFILEFVIYCFAASEYKKVYSKILHLIQVPYFIYSYQHDFAEQSYQRFDRANNIYLRNPEKNYLHTKKPVLIFGCSFAHGTFYLKNEQTVSFKIFEKTNRDVYNYGFPGCGAQHMLFFIRNIIPYKIPKREDPAYAIYIYIPNHLFRLRTDIYPTLFSNGKTLQYKINNGDLVLEKPLFKIPYKLFTIKFFLSINDYIKKRNSKIDAMENFILLNSIFLESKEALQKRYPNLKFIILRYQVDGEDNFRELPYMWETLKNQGFIVINSSDLIGRKFVNNTDDTVADGYHPSELAWDLLVPALIKELNL